MQPLRLSAVVAFEVLWRFHQDGHTCKCSAWKIIYFLDYLLYVTSKPDNNKLDCLIVSWISDFDKMHAYTDVSLAVFFKECIQDFTTSNLFFFCFFRSFFFYKLTTHGLDSFNNGSTDMALFSYGIRLQLHWILWRNWQWN